MPLAADSGSEVEYRALHYRNRVWIAKKGAEPVPCPFWISSLAAAAYPTTGRDSRRLKATPIPATPRIIIAHDVGSGAALLNSV